MNWFESANRIHQQARRRLTELEIAVGIAGDSGIAWHIRQAARSGASLVEVQTAIKLGMEMRGIPPTALREFTRDTFEQVFNLRHASQR